MENSRLYTTLAFAGALPFLAAAVLAVGGVRAIPIVGDPYGIATSYALAILCFIAGTHWALQLVQPSGTPFDLFISSNVAVVIVWLAYLAVSSKWVLVIQAAAFAALLLIDYRSCGLGVLSRHYFRARAVATTAAVASLLVVMVAI